MSVVIPTFKRPEHLRSAFNSAAMQTARPSIIIIADNDPDRSAVTVAKELDSPAIPVKYVEANQLPGPAFARNRGAEQCSTEWIAFLDDDDLWTDNYLDTVLTKSEEEQSDIVLTWIGLEVSGSVVAVKKLPTNMTLDAVVQYGNPGVTGSNIVVSRALFDALSGFDEEFMASEDIDLLLRVIDKGIPYAVNQNVQVTHIVHDGGHLSDLSGGAVTSGSARLLQKYGAKLSWRSRNRLRAKMHLAAFSSSNRKSNRIYHALMAAVRGERHAIKTLIK